MKKKTVSILLFYILKKEIINKNIKFSLESKGRHNFYGKFYHQQFNTIVYLFLNVNYNSKMILTSFSFYLIVTYFQLWLDNNEKSR